MHVRIYVVCIGLKLNTSLAYETIGIKLKDVNNCELVNKESQGTLKQIVSQEFTHFCKTMKILESDDGYFCQSTYLNLEEAAG